MSYGMYFVQKIDCIITVPHCMSFSSAHFYAPFQAVLAGAGSKFLGQWWWLALSLHPAMYAGCTVLFLACLIVVVIYLAGLRFVAIFVSYIQFYWLLGGRLWYLYCWYTGITRSISWLLMPWLPVSPGHIQPWHWSCRVNGSLCPRRGRISTTCASSVLRNDRKCEQFFLYFLR